MVGTRFDGTLDEHCFVDPLTGECPVKRTDAAVHRQVEPENQRSDGHTPKGPEKASPSLVFEPRPDRSDRVRLYRHGTPVTLMESGWNEALARVQSSYADLTSEAQSGSQWLPIEGLGAEAGEISGASRAHIEVQRWLNSPRLVVQ